MSIGGDSGLAGAMMLCVADRFCLRATRSAILTTVGVLSTGGSELLACSSLGERCGTPRIDTCFDIRCKSPIESNWLLGDFFIFYTRNEQRGGGNSSQQS